MQVDTITYSVIDSVKNTNALIESWDNGIIYIKIDDSTETSLEDSMSQYNYIKSKYDGVNKLRILVEPGKFTSISKEAREFSAKPENNLMTMASAVIIKSLAQRIVINFMINVIQRQTMKMKIFEDKYKAMDWLLSLKA